MVALKHTKPQIGTAKASSGVGIFMLIHYNLVPNLNLIPCYQLWSKQVAYSQKHYQLQKPTIFQKQFLILTVCD